MLYGRIDRTHGINPAWEIEVDGWPMIRYMDCGKAQAVAAYRRAYGLIGKRVHWNDYTKPGTPQNLFDAYMQYIGGANNE